MGIRYPSLLCENELISVHSGKASRNYVVVPYEDAPEKYARFLAFVCQAYRVLNSQSIERLEALCKELLKPNQPTKEPTRYNIHKSIFERKILRDRIIRVFLKPSYIFSEL